MRFLVLVFDGLLRHLWRSGSQLQHLMQVNCKAQRKMRRRRFDSTINLSTPSHFLQGTDCYHLSFFFSFFHYCCLVFEHVVACLLSFVLITIPRFSTSFFTRAQLINILITMKVLTRSLFVSLFSTDPFHWYDSSSLNFVPVFVWNNSCLPFD